MMCFRMILQYKLIHLLSAVFNWATSNFIFTKLLLELSALLERFTDTCVRDSRASWQGSAAPLQFYLLWVLLLSSAGLCISFPSLVLLAVVIRLCSGTAQGIQLPENVFLFCFVLPLATLLLVQSFLNVTPCVIRQLMAQGSTSA